MKKLSIIGLLLLLFSLFNILAKPVCQCTVTANCATGSVSCTSNNCDCKLGANYVECDGVRINCPET